VIANKSRITEFSISFDHTTNGMVEILVSLRHYECLSIIFIRGTDRQGTSRDSLENAIIIF
jgi:hypothetical protein